MLNEDGEEEIFVTAAGVKPGTSIPDQVYTMDKSHAFADMSESDSEDDVGKKRTVIKRTGNCFNHGELLFYFIVVMSVLIMTSYSL